MNIAELAVLMATVSFAIGIFLGRFGKTFGRTSSRDARTTFLQHALGSRHAEELHAEWLDLPKRPRRIRVLYALRVARRVPAVRLADYRRARHRSKS